jgi:hypothetical protein
MLYPTQQEEPMPRPTKYRRCYVAAWEAAALGIAAALSHPPTPRDRPDAPHTTAAQDALEDIYRRLCDAHGDMGDIRRELLAAATDDARDAV